MSQGKESVIRHRGVITCLDPLKAEIIAESACASCHARGVCMLSEKKIKEITLLKHPEHWKPILGQEVFIEMRTRLGFRALWLGMVLPAIVLGIITALCVWSGMAEWLLGLIVLSGMGIYYFVLYLLKDHIRNDFYFTVHNIEP